MLNVRVLYITHHPNIRGGIEEVTRMFMRRFPQFGYFFSVKGRPAAWQYRLYYLLAWFRFLGRLLIFRPAVVHVNLGMHQDLVRNLPYIWLTRLYGARLLVQTHLEVNWQFARYPRPLRGIVRWSMRQADMFVFLTPALERAFKRFAPDVQTAVVSISVPDQFFDQTPPPYEARRNLVVYLGRFHPQKGTDILVSAAQRHVQTDTTVAYELHGYGPIPVPPHDRIVSDGWIGLDQKIALLRDARLVVMPSREEAFGLLIPEAMACGTPVVATNVGGIPNVMADGVHGMLVEPENPDQLINAIRRVMADQRQWERMSRNCQITALAYQEFRLEAEWKKVYARLARPAAEPVTEPIGRSAIRTRRAYR